MSGTIGIVLGSLPEEEDGGAKVMRSSNEKVGCKSPKVIVGPEKS